MATWYLSKVRYLREVEGKGIRPVTEHFLMDSVSFSDAEARVYAELSPTISEFVITGVSKTKYQEIFPYEGIGFWYRCKIVYKTYDEATGKENRVQQLVLLNAADIRQVYDRITDQLQGTTLEYEITEVVKSPIVEVYPYNPAEETTEPELSSNNIGTVQDLES
ncbi:MAG: DUF4494 domain-containing protein [Bacteroidia bacterium]|nr:DUF4494 domain-containing protein [Bacteroidia bacterium]